MRIPFFREEALHDFRPAPPPAAAVLLASVFEPPTDAFDADADEDFNPDDLYLDIGVGD